MSHFYNIELEWLSSLPNKKRKKKKVTLDIYANEINLLKDQGL